MYDAFARGSANSLLAILTLKTCPSAMFLSPLADNINFTALVIATEVICESMRNVQERFDEHTNSRGTSGSTCNVRARESYVFF